MATPEKLKNIVGMSIEASGLKAAVGDICRIYSDDTGGQINAEVVGFRDDRVLLMPYSEMSGISAGNFVRTPANSCGCGWGLF